MCVVRLCWGSMHAYQRMTYRALKVPKMLVNITRGHKCVGMGVNWPIKRVVRQLVSQTEADYTIYAASSGSYCIMQRPCIMLAVEKTTREGWGHVHTPVQRVGGTHKAFARKQMLQKGILYFMKLSQVST